MRPLQFSLQLPSPRTHNPNFQIYFVPEKKKERERGKKKEKKRSKYKEKKMYNVILVFSSSLPPHVFPLKYYVLHETFHDILFCLFACLSSFFFTLGLWSFFFVFYWFRRCFFITCFFFSFFSSLFSILVCLFSFFIDCLFLNYYYYYYFYYYFLFFPSQTSC
ncbi:T. brucei spp.-specific protein [Trypanosoma brucei gambiense DAL972]|uniref:Uncharacterized protein n=1 Tax=Trypanosoma brucei gambiense (strain MHOM/CI/86/DAL972) TaxID=679716 RepID=C9ZK45_TRYB9|nr:T. brucei spp.-specific protein [Trypanosoma brucei gambiense DAL972]CBH09809.1 T. brucei spp.-specific protein [Trypanosoma brucei gambiense DAL972]|eukprot:XP_011772102.1 T. brucei spp.-specific protein [Trypanosoma brucei gambiense DAL972]